MSHHSHHHHDHDHDHSHHHPHHEHHHHHGHGHGGHSHHHHGGNAKGLSIALLITASILLLEFFGGILTNSLALLSDSGHMLSDTASMVLSLAAMRFAAKPASPEKTYGFYRFEILAALVNGAALFVIAGVIVWQAYQRFIDPPAVASGSMMLIASIGLLANLLSAWVLMRKSDIKDNLNIRSAYLHIIGDALGSVGAIVAGGLMYFFDWYIADPIISMAVALLILKSGWGVLKHAVHILMEGAPASIDCCEVKETLLGVDGVLDVHDFHLWTITSGLDTLTCHLLIEDGKDSQTVLQEAIRLMEDRYSIDHVTIQVEKSGLTHAELRV